MYIHITLLLRILNKQSFFILSKFGVFGGGQHRGKIPDSGIIPHSHRVLM